MKPNQILILGSIVTVILTLLWYFKIISEPIAALGPAVLTLISYLLARNNQNKGKTINKTKITQNHSGSGDNVAGNKYGK